MKTPICDFIKEYSDSHSLRLHMPGHKGIGPDRLYESDITEIYGAGALYERDGIIAESEKNASRLFGCPTFYSTEGSSQCIKAMLFLACMHGAKKRLTPNTRPLIAAGRNVHKAFVSAAALIDFDIMWIYPPEQDESGVFSCGIDPEGLDRALCSSPRTPDAVYLTGPDYLGGMQDIHSLSSICKRHGVMLIVDNAHGAYLKFLSPSLHPMDLGADMCCDSAHKTLPVLTAGAYLHISANMTDEIAAAKKALLLFGSTSPSYLTLSSLDAANRSLSSDFPERLDEFAASVRKLREKLTDEGFSLYGGEPMKLTLKTKPYGYYGFEMASILRNKHIECEFSDRDFIVFMLSPVIGSSGLSRLHRALSEIDKRPPIDEKIPAIPRARRAMSVREAVFSPGEHVPAEKCLGRIVASESISCPPATPIAISGEVIDDCTLNCLKYYGFSGCDVVCRAEDDLDN